MYDELIRQIRACCNGEPCEEVNCGFNPKSDLDCIEQLLTRAADAIEDLENRLNLWRHDKISRWIPVTERLPELGEVVLLTDGIDTGDGYLAMYDFSTECPLWSTPFVDLETENITHWMPLPQPPKENEK